MMDLPEYAVLDGGVATEIVASQGLNDVMSDPLWAARLLKTNPTAVKNVHKRFLDAGSDIIETATYQASIEGFHKHLGTSSEEALDLLKSSVSLAKQVRDQFWAENKESGRMKPLVAGSVSPYGAHLADGSENSGNYVDSMSVQDLVDWHRPVVKALLEAGVDLLAFETIPAQKEAQALVSLMGEFPTGRAMLSLNSMDGQKTAHGENMADVFRLTISTPQVVAVGFNCTSPLHIEGLLKSIPDEVRACKKVAVYPNSGEMWDEIAKTWSFRGREGCPKIASLVPRWMNIGVNWIGGCCRTTSDDISSIKKEMLQWIEKRKTA